MVDVKYFFIDILLLHQTRSFEIQIKSS